MSDSEASYPTFPPGFWRRIRLLPGPGRIAGALEDDMHSFRLRIDHEDDRITGVNAVAVRHPWTACAAAGAHLATELQGETLEKVAAHEPTLECTHLFDLAILCAAHAHDTGPSCYDMRVADRIEDRTTATLDLNGIQQVVWQLEGTVIRGPERFAGLDIKRVSKWKHDFPENEAEWSTLLRRAIFVSGARQYETPTNVRASQMGPTRLGVCFNYQMPQAGESTPIFDRRDFSSGEVEPLEGLGVEKLFMEAGD